MIRQFLVLTAIILVTFACGSKETKVPTVTAESKPAVDGAKIYRQSCELCHGPDGKLGANGSKDLTMSEYDLDTRIQQILKGKGLMTPFENILSLEEIRAVAEYTMAMSTQ